MSNNVTIPATGSGTATPVVETIDTTGSGGPQRQVITIGDRAGTAVDSIGGLTETAPATDTASSGLNGRLQRVAQRLTSLIALFPAALTTGAQALKTGRIWSTPTSVLTRPANTTAYSAGNLIASSTTAGSVVVPSFTATPNAQGHGSIKRLRLTTNKTSGMAGIQVNVDLWSAAPTFTNGDGGAYAVATGAAAYLGSAQVTLAQAGDGAYGIATPNIGDAINFALASGQAIYWSLSAVGVFTPASGQTFTLQPEIQQD